NRVFKLYPMWAPKLTFLGAEIGPQSGWLRPVPRRGCRRSGGDDRSRFFNRRPPTQVELARGTDFVEPPHRGVMRRGLDDLGVRRNLRDDLLDGGDELIERGLGLGFRGLDHQRLRNDQRKVDRRRVEAEIDQPLGDVFRRYALRLR